MVNIWVSLDAISISDSLIDYLNVSFGSSITVYFGEFLLSLVKLISRLFDASSSD